MYGNIFAGGPMKIVLMVACLCFSGAAFAADSTSKIMKELGTELDIAESSLRIITGEYADGKNHAKWSKSDACNDKLNAALALLNFEQRHPGYLEGKYGTANWGQYTEVRRLFDKIASKNQFFYKGAPVAPAAAGSVPTTPATH